MVSGCKPVRLVRCLHRHSNNNLYHTIYVYHASSGRVVSGSLNMISLYALIYLHLHLRAIFFALRKLFLPLRLLQRSHVSLPLPFHDWFD